MDHHGEDIMGIKTNKETKRLKKQSLMRGRDFVGGEYPGFKVRILILSPNYFLSLLRGLCKGLE